MKQSALPNKKNIPLNEERVIKRYIHNAFAIQQSYDMLDSIYFLNLSHLGGYQAAKTFGKGILSENVNYSTD